MKAVSKQSLTNGEVESIEPSNSHHQYKEVIRVQERKINELSGENETLKSELEGLKQYVNDLQRQNTELRLQVRMICSTCIRDLVYSSIRTYFNRSYD